MTQILHNKTDQRTGKSDRADEKAHNLTGKHDKGSMKSYRLLHLQLLATFTADYFATLKVFLFANLPRFDVIVNLIKCFSHL